MKLYVELGDAGDKAKKAGHTYAVSAPQDVAEKFVYTYGAQNMSPEVNRPGFPGGSIP